jgi:hypothetical protein
MTSETTYATVRITYEFRKGEILITSEWEQNGTQMEGRGQIKWLDQKAVLPFRGEIELISKSINLVCDEVNARNGGNSTILNNQEVTQLVNYVRMMNVGLGIYHFKLVLYETTYDFKLLHRDYLLETSTETTQTPSLQIR